MQNPSKERGRNNCRTIVVGHVSNVPGTMESCPTGLRLIVLLIAWILPLVPAAQAIDRIEPPPKDLENVGVAEHLDTQVPLELPFVDSDGTPVTLAKLFDGTRPVILTMNYSNCPRLCSLQLNGVFSALQRMDWNLGQKFQMITVSIDPQESPTRAQATKEKYLAVYNRPNAEDGLHFLVGKEEDIKKLAAAVGFAYVYVAETKQFAHTAVTMILTPGGRVSRYLYGIEYDPQTVRFSLLEAAEGKIGSTVDRVLLNCFYYDAEAGRYGPAAVKIMRLGGIVTLVILGSVLLLFWGRELRKSKQAAALGAGCAALGAGRAALGAGLPTPPTQPTTGLPQEEENTNPQRTEAP